MDRATAKFSSREILTTSSERRALLPDTEGALGLRALSDWLVSVQLRPAGNVSELDRYVGYWKRYATSCWP
jgi:hypothetical protein